MTNRVHEYTEPVNDPPYEGTIIDVETNHDLNPICFGTIHGNQLAILYITDDNPDTWIQFAQAITEKLVTLPRPYLAFRAVFDQTVLSNFLDRSIPFDGDLHLLPYSKDKTARKLGAPHIPDPFKGQSSQVPYTWDKYLRTKQPFLIDRIIKHNRSCLLKETHISQHAGWTPISDYVLTTKRTNTMTPKNQRTRLLLQALHQQRIITIIYRNQKGDETTRDVAILTLGHQYFTAYCPLRNELRTFKINRLTHLQLRTTKLENTNSFW